VGKDFVIMGFTKGKKTIAKHTPREAHITAKIPEQDATPPPAAAAKAGRNNFLSKLKETNSPHTTIGEQYSQTISVI
jgi:hypothetical protein